MGIYQAMQSVRLKQDLLDDEGNLLLKEGQAGYVVADHSALVDGVYAGIVEVKMDVDNTVYEIDATDIQGL